MGRFSPTVVPTGISPIAAGLRGATEGFMKSRQERRRERLAKQREERLDELSKLNELRRRAEEVRLARQGYLPEEAGGDITRGGARQEEPITLTDALMRENIEDAVSPIRDDFTGVEGLVETEPEPPAARSPFELPGHHGRAGPRATTPGINPSEPHPMEESDNLAEALRVTRGERNRRLFPPGDVRNDYMGEGPAAERIPLPSGGSVSALTPEQQREQQQQREVVELLEQGGMDKTRAEVYVRTGQDLLKPDEASGAFMPSVADLRALGATDAEARLAAQDPTGETARDLLDDLVGRRSSSSADIERSQPYTRALRHFRQNPDADPERVSALTGLSLSDALDAQKTARSSVESGPRGQGRQAIESTLGARAANSRERAVVDAIAESGSILEVRQQINQRARQIANANLPPQRINELQTQLGAMSDALNDLISRSRYRTVEEAEEGLSMSEAFLRSLGPSRSGGRREF